MWDKYTLKNSIIKNKLKLYKVHGENIPALEKYTISVRNYNLLLRDLKPLK